jgi:hypothetical protein
MLLKLSYLVSFRFRINLQVGTGTWNLYHVLVANVVMLRKGKDTTAGNWPLNTRSNIFYIRLFPLYII